MTLLKARLKQLNPSGPSLHPSGPSVIASFLDSVRIKVTERTSHFVPHGTSNHEALSVSFPRPCYSVGVYPRNRQWQLGAPDARLLSPKHTAPSDGTPPHRNKAVERLKVSALNEYSENCGISTDPQPPADPRWLIQEQRS